jgi:hypothetical protein
VSNREERLVLGKRYIGRHSSHRRHRFVTRHELTTPLARSWERRIRQVSESRADNFKHYVIAMTKAFSNFASSIRPNGHLVIVVGQSAWGGERIPTPKLFREIAGNLFEPREELWYPLPNRYMSYERRNDADINKDFVLVFQRVHSRERAR